MKRGPGYGDANANPYAASQMQHMSAQRMQQNSAVSDFQDRSEFRAEEERKYNSTKGEGQWQWDRDAQQMSPHLYSDGQGGNSSRSFYGSQAQGVKLGPGPNQESRIKPDKQDMELGYEDNPAHQTLKSLERTFHDDIVKLTTEHVDAEDAENARHREKIMEINNQYQEQLLTLRARHATRREEILHKESQARLQQYQLAGMNHYQNSTGPSDVIPSHSGYGAPAPGPVTGEPQRQYGGGQFDSFRHHPEPFGRGRMQGAETRVPSRGGGRVFNTGPGPRYY